MEVSPAPQRLQVLILATKSRFKLCRDVGCVWRTQGECKLCQCLSDGYAGGGAFKHAEIFKERLGVVLEKEDEIACLVGGTNFLLQTIPHEAFTYTAASGTTFAPTNGEFVCKCT